MQTISLVFLVCPKYHSARCSFYPGRTSHMRLIFCSHSANFPKIHAAIVQASACSPLRTARAKNRFPALVRSSVEPFFGISNFGQKRQNAPFWGRCCSATGANNPCCSTTATFVFLVRVARYANHFYSLLGSPKIPFCRCSFYPSRTSRMRLIFCSTQPNFPENPCCYSAGQCCSPTVNCQG